MNHVPATGFETLSWRTLSFNVPFFVFNILGRGVGFIHRADC